MKKASLLLLAATLCFCACKHQEEPYNYQDKDITGETVELSKYIDCQKIFLLNEGQMGANNASLDVLRVKDKQYINGIWKKMNPGEGPGLGDVANDIGIKNNEVWIVVNNSGYVEIISALDETHIASVNIPTPRCIAFDDDYAYVTSYSGSFIEYDSNYAIVNSKNSKGHVYRIDLKTHKLVGSPVEVGYQPEGLAVYDGKLYVANSGGLASQLPPDYAYDNKVSVIDTKTFTLERNIEVAINLDRVYYNGKDAIYVTSMGDFYKVHSGLYVIKNNRPTKVDAHISKSFMCDDGTLFAIGTESELDYSAKHDYTLSSYRIDEEDPTFVKNTYYNIEIDATTPYAIAIVDNYLLVADAGDYFNPGSLSLYENIDLTLTRKKTWTVTTGVCPGHFAIWE